MSISAQFLPQKISAHFQFHLLNLREKKSEHLGQLFVTPEIIAKKIKKMKDNKSPGVDGIPPKLLKEIVEQISAPLTKENYRPVGLTSVVCKLLKTLIRDHMVEFLVKHKLINTSQHGFLKARSCLTNLLCFLEEIRKWIDDGSPVDVVYLDFQKAFDKVPHQRLLLKLKAHGIGNDVINWIEKWLTHRRQRVIVDGEISNWKSVLSGVPQGSVLGPILFLIYIYIYINDLADGISSKVLKFADDTKVFRKVTNDTDKQSLQDDLEKLVK